MIVRVYRNFKHELYDTRIPEVLFRFEGKFEMHVLEYILGTAIWLGGFLTCLPILLL